MNSYHYGSICFIIIHKSFSKHRKAREWTTDPWITPDSTGSNKNVAASYRPISVRTLHIASDRLENVQTSSDNNRQCQPAAFCVIKYYL